MKIRAKMEEMTKTKIKRTVKVKTIRMQNNLIKIRNN